MKTKTRNLKYNFSPIEEDVISAFAKHIKADRIEQKKSIFNQQITNIVSGLTEIEISVLEQKKRRFLLICAINIGTGNHYISDYLTNPVELLSELNRLKKRLN